MRPVVENIASTGTDAEDMDKYSSARFQSIGNRLECRCQIANGSVSEPAHFHSYAVCHFHGNVSWELEVSCGEMSLSAATLISREKYGG